MSRLGTRELNAAASRELVVPRPPLTEPDSYRQLIC